MKQLLIGVLIPFVGTSLGAALVFLPQGKKQGGAMNQTVEKILTGFAAGIMVSASFFSLLLPALEQASAMGKMRVIPAVIGFLLGMGFLLLLDYTVPHLHRDSDEPEGAKVKIKKTSMMLLAVILHNIPEGMAVGVIFAAWRSGSEAISVTAALSLAIGIAIQNFPEGAIVSMPLAAEGFSKKRAFLGGVISGAVEPIGAIVTILAAGFVVPVMPYLLSFAAGAMIYVVVEELIPEMAQGEHSNHSTISFALGFSLMMLLDVMLG
ncbi:MAG: ZIP family metal transporter [Eubacteriales bacterium]|nr:ZIP family metal transporter [Eubacteriales bacterium]